VIWDTEASGTIDVGNVATVVVDALTSAGRDGTSLDVSVPEARSLDAFAGDYARVSRLFQCSTVDSVAAERRSVGVKAGVRADP